MIVFGAFTVWSKDTELNVPAALDTLLSGGDDAVEF